MKAKEFVKNISPFNNLEEMPKTLYIIKKALHIMRDIKTLLQTATLVFLLIHLAFRYKLTTKQRSLYYSIYQ